MLPKVRGQIMLPLPFPRPLMYPLATDLSEAWS